MNLIGRILLYCGLLVMAIGVAIGLLSENADFVRQMNWLLPDLVVDWLLCGLKTMGCGVVGSVVGILVLCGRRLTKQEMMSQAVDDPDTWHLRPFGVVVLICTFALIGWGIDTMTNGQIRGLPKGTKQWIGGLFVLPLMLLLTSRRIRGKLFCFDKPRQSDSRGVSNVNQVSNGSKETDYHDTGE